MYGLTTKGTPETDQPHTPAAQPDEEVVEVGASARQFKIYLPTFPHPGDTSRVDDCQYGPGERMGFAAVAAAYESDI